MTNGKTKDGAFYRSFLIMTLTMALQNVIVFGVNLADSVMLGAYSESALAGSAVCNQIQFFLLMLSNGVSAGMVVICSQFWGQKETKPIHRVFAVAMWLGLILSAGLTLAACVAPDGLLGIFTNDAGIIAVARDYLSIIKYTYIIFMVTSLLTAVMRSVETVRIGFYASLSSFGLNVLLNYALIYGRLGMPEMGIRGAALATLASRVVELAVVLVYVLFVDKKLRLKVQSFFAVQSKYVVMFIKTGVPLMMSSVSWGFAMSVQGAIIGRLGQTAISANSIATTVFQVASVVCYAASNAACVLVGKSVGEGRPAELMKRRAHRLQLIFLGVGVLSSAILLLCKSAILGYYNTTEQTTRMTEIFIYILAVTIVGTSYQVPCLGGIVSGAGETSFVFKNDLIFMWGIVLPLSYVSAFVLRLPVPVTFACLKADQILKCAVAVIKVNRFKWAANVAKHTSL